MVDGVANNALQCAIYLTRKEPEELQVVFRQFPWVRLRDYLIADKRSRREREVIIKTARSLGVPI